MRARIHSTAKSRARAHFSSENKRIIYICEPNKAKHDKN